MLKESIDKLIEAQKHVIDSYISGNTDDLFKAMRLMIESTQKIGATRAQWEAMAGLCLPENKERYADAVILYNDSDGIEGGEVYSCEYSAADALIEHFGAGEVPSHFRLAGIFHDNTEFVDMDAELEQALEERTTEAKEDEKYNSPAALRRWYHSQVL